MYSTTAYLYQQIQQVLLIDISGNYFNARWNPVYAKSLKCNLGVDNVILFQFLNQDQKPVNISGSTFTFRIISQNGEDLLYARELVTLSATTGRAKVTIPAADTLKFQAQPASWSIEVSSGNLDQAVLTDDYSGARGDIDLVNTVFPAFVASRVLTIPDQAPDSSIYYTSTLTTDGTRQTTFQIDSVDFTGTLSVQGSTAATAETVEWYSIPFRDLESGNVVESLTLVSATKRLGINVAGYHPYLRIELSISNGNVDLIQYR